MVGLQVPQDVAMKLLPYRVDDGEWGRRTRLRWNVLSGSRARPECMTAGAKAYKSMDRGAEIDWVALAKGRHDYVTKVKRGEVISL